MLAFLENYAFLFFVLYLGFGAAALALLTGLMISAVNKKLEATERVRYGEIHHAVDWFRLAGRYRALYPTGPLAVLIVVGNILWVIGALVVFRYL